jgi:hypothetical protein
VVGTRIAAVKAPIELSGPRTSAVGAVTGRDGGTADAGDQCRAEYG